MVKNAFCNSNAYDLKATEPFTSIVWAKLVVYLKNQKDAFYEKFQDKFRESYNEEFVQSASSFRKIVREIYSDISANFSKIFRKSEEFLPKLAREFTYDTVLQQPDHGGYVAKILHTYETESKFFVQRVYFFI